MKSIRKIPTLLVFSMLTATAAQAIDYSPSVPGHYSFLGFHSTQKHEDAVSYASSFNGLGMQLVNQSLEKSSSGKVQVKDYSYERKAGYSAGADEPASMRFDILSRNGQTLKISTFLRFPGNRSGCEQALRSIDNALQKNYGPSDPQDNYRTQFAWKRGEESLQLEDHCLTSVPMVAVHLRGPRK